MARFFGPAKSGPQKKITVYNEHGHVMNINDWQFDPEVHSLEPPKKAPAKKAPAKRKPAAKAKE